MQIDDEEAASRAESKAEGGDGMGAYLEAMRGEDGHTRNAKGKTIFNKTQGKRARGDDEFEEAVVEGIKELDVGEGKKRQKKVKRESVKIGAEFKAKVRPFCHALSLRPFTDTVIVERRWRRREERHEPVRVRAAPERRGQEQELARPQDGHHRPQDGQEAEVVCLGLLSNYRGFGVLLLETCCLPLSLLLDLRPCVDRKSVV